MSTVCASSVSPLSYRNTIFNQSPHLFSRDCFLNYDNYNNYYYVFLTFACQLQDSYQFFYMFKLIESLNLAKRLLYYNSTEKTTRYNDIRM